MLLEADQNVIYQKTQGRFEEKVARQYIYKSQKTKRKILSAVEQGL